MLVHSRSSVTGIVTGCYFDYIKLIDLFVINRTIEYFVKLISQCGVFIYVKELRRDKMPSNLLLPRIHNYDFNILFKIRLFWIILYPWYFLFTFKPMMDRNKHSELPSMQVGFIDFVCMPLYKVVYHSFATSFYFTIVTLWRFYYQPLEGWCNVSLLLEIFQKWKNIFFNSWTVELHHWNEIMKWMLNHQKLLLISPVFKNIDTLNSRLFELNIIRIFLVFLWFERFSNPVKEKRP